MSMISLIIIGFIVMFVVMLFSSVKKAQDDQENIKTQNEKIKNHNYSISADYSYTHLGDKLFIRFVFDNNNRKLIVFENGKEDAVYSFKNILGCDVFLNAKKTMGIGRAAVGGAIAGVPGAIIGSMGAPDEITSYILVMYFTNNEQPTREFKLIDEKVKTSSAYYQDGIKFVNNITSYINNIVKSPNNSMNQIRSEGTEPENRYCSQCGAKLRETDKFCRNCGNQID